jgi:iron complex outermembrane receptor protein
MGNRNSLIACAIAQALAMPAYAQDASAGDADTKVMEQVVVVGSRIRRIDIETSQPVFVLERAQLERTGLVSVGDILQELTAHGAALNTTFNNGGDGSTRVDLRNLGDNRTLVLVNGRRWITGLDGGVDLNSIPLAVIERIEVLKDGASAIYGSDAIAGVINITTVDSYDGMEARAYLGESAEGDGRVESYDFTLGTSSERASVVANVSYVKQEPIFAGAREISAVPVFGLPPNDVYAGASATTPYGRFGFGRVGNCPFDPSGNYPASGQCPLPPGYAFRGLNRNTYDPETGAWPVFDPVTGGYNFAPENYLQTPQERTALYAQGRYDLADTAAFSFELLYNERLSSQELAPIPIVIGVNAQGLNRITVPAAQVYNPFGQTVTQLAIRPGGQVRNFAQDADTFRFGSGFQGTFDLADRAYAWDLNAIYGEYTISGRTEGLVNLGRVGNALGPSFFDAGGNAVCGTPGAIIAGCVPLDVFRGPEALAPAMLDYIYYTAQDTQQTRSWNYTANLTGDLLDLPAGPLAFAAGYEYRRETGEALQDTLRAQLDNLDNSTYSGSVSVDEMYLELSIPLLADVLLAQTLEINLAGRYSDYDTFGDTTNFKGGLRWKPVDQLLVRGSYSQGFRAPTVSDLYFPVATNSNTLDSDPCGTEFYAAGETPSAEVLANCVADGVPGGTYEPAGAVFQDLIGGNPDLLPETSVSKTLGLVWNPPWIAGLDLSLDWYEIAIDDAISVAFSDELLRYCAFDAVPEACARTTRDPASGELLRVDARNLNSGELRVEGYDLTVNYRFDTRVGRFSILWDTSYTAEYVIESPRGSGLRSVPGNNFTFEPGFRIRSNLDLAWQRGDWGAAAGLRYYSPLDEGCFAPTNAGYVELCSSPDVVSPIYFGYPENRLGSRTYLDLQASWNAPWNARVTAGVQNATDRDPPVSYTAFANSFDPAYPIPGRFWYASYTQKF